MSFQPICLINLFVFVEVGSVTGHHFCWLAGLSGQKTKRKRQIWPKSIFKNGQIFKQNKRPNKVKKFIILDRLKGGSS